MVVSKEERERRSQRIKALWKNPEFRKIASKRMSETAKKLWKNKEFREIHIQRFIKRNKIVRYKGDEHYNWKGGRYLGSDGYIHIYYPNHPNRDARGYVVEHRILLEHKLKRILRKEEIVHHKNGIRTDNSIENLELMKDIKEHNRMHEHPRDSRTGRYLPFPYPVEESRLP